MKRLTALLALTLAACHSTVEPPPRPHFASTISATKCANGKFSLTTTWQVTGDWKAIFEPISGSRSETTPVNSSQTKTSSCLFLAGDVVYAILYPDLSSKNPVQSDADNSPTITVR